MIGESGGANQLDAGDFTQRIIHRMNCGPCEFGYRKTAIVVQQYRWRREWVF